MQHVKKAGGIVLNAKGEVLIVTNHLDRQTLPKGSPEADEQPIDTARREITEESGLTEFVIGRQLGVIIRQGYTDDNSAEPSVIKHIDIFLCTTEQTELQPQASDIKSAEWVPQDRVSQVLSWPEEAEFFESQRAALTS